MNRVRVGSSWPEPLAFCARLFNKSSEKTRARTRAHAQLSLAVRTSVLPLSLIKQLFTRQKSYVGALFMFNKGGIFLQVCILLLQVMAESIYKENPHNLILRKKSPFFI